MSKLNILLPDWVAKRQQKEQVEEFLDAAAKQARENERLEKQAQRLRLRKGDGGREAHKIKMATKRHKKNKTAKQARKRNRVG